LDRILANQKKLIELSFKRLIDYTIVNFRSSMQRLLELRGVANLIATSEIKILTPVFSKPTGLGCALSQTFCIFTRDSRMLRAC